MAKRVILPITFSITTVDGTGLFNAGVLAGTIRRIVIVGPNGPPTPDGRITLRDLDNAIDIFKDPLPSKAEVDMDFFQKTIKIPVNGSYRWVISESNTDDVFDGYFIIEERPQVL